MWNENKIKNNYICVLETKDLDANYTCFYYSQGLRIKVEGSFCRITF